MRAFLAYAVALTLILAFTIQPATAVTSFNGMGIPYITSCGFTFMQPFSVTNLVEVEFNSARVSSLDFETLDIDFPLSTDNFIAGPTGGLSGSDGISLGAEATSNILPFGLVNLAFPSMEQTRLQQAEYERTYFFTDTIG